MVAQTGIRRCNSADFTNFPDRPYSELIRANPTYGK